MLTARQVDGACYCSNYRAYGDDDFRMNMCLQFSEIFEDLGLELKMRSSTTSDDSFTTALDTLPTFLKGTWYPLAKPAIIDSHPYIQRIENHRYLCIPSHLERAWGPLPSRLLKLGKTFRDPRELFGVQSLDVALTAFADNMAQSVQDFTWPPAIQRWLKSLRVAAPGTVNLPAARKETLRQFHGDLYGLMTIAPTELQGLTIDETRATIELAAHYCVDIDTLFDFWEKLEQLRPLQHMEHPVWWALTKDYA